jgi:hypothetical protein
MGGKAQYLVVGLVNILIVSFVNSNGDADENATQCNQGYQVVAQTKPDNP